MRILSNAFRRMLYIGSILSYSGMVLIPVSIYMVYGWPCYAFFGDSGLGDTWMANNDLLTFIYTMDPDGITDVRNS